MSSKVVIGDLTFTYDRKIHQPIEEGCWYWIYFDVTLATGEKVPQISVEYNFGPDRHDIHAPAIKVYFENDGDVHFVDRSTQLSLPGSA